MTTLILGANGQLGKTFQDLAKKRFDSKGFVFWGREELDFTHPDEFSQINAKRFDLVINCAAYTAVDKAEEERSLAKMINSTSVGLLGSQAAKEGIPIIHFSSDYVYHNYLRRPMRENDPCRPKGYYARSKRMGELNLLDNHPFPLIFRVSWLYSRFGHNFPKTMLRLGKERASVSVVDDQHGAPTYADDVVDVIFQIIGSHQTKKDWQSAAGIYNYCNAGATTWHQIAQRVMQQANLPCAVLPIPSRAYPTAAPRPRNSLLDLSKFKRKFEIPTVPWQSRIDACIHALINES